MVSFFANCQSAALPVDPALFLSGCISMRTSICRVMSWWNAPVPLLRSCLQRPTLIQRLILPSEPFWLIRPLLVLALESPSKSGQKSPVPAASTGRRSGHSGTLQETTGGTQTHSRRTLSKLGRLHRARQAIVRVPESNTKYGAKYGKPEAPSPLQCRQLSVSPEGFPRKKVVALGTRRASPRCSQENFLLRPCGRQGIALGRLT